MPHWLSAIICNAVCHLKRELRNWQLKKQMGNPRNSQQLKTNYNMLCFQMNSIPLKHKVQSGIAAPCPFPASFIGHFTAIFYAHGRKINVEISSLEVCSLCFIFCVWYRKADWINANPITCWRQLKYIQLFWTFPSFIVNTFCEMDYTEEWSCGLSSSLPSLVFLFLGICFEFNAHCHFAVFCCCCFCFWFFRLLYIFPSSKGNDIWQPGPT